MLISIASLLIDWLRIVLFCDNLNLGNQYYSSLIFVTAKNSENKSISCPICKKNSVEYVLALISVNFLKLAPRAV